MIAWLKGRLVAREGHRGVIDVRDVGYAVQAPARDLDAWAMAEDAVEVFVTTEVREDAITLYGFSTDADRVAFDRLRQVDGVGPKTALAALDTLGLPGLAKAVGADDLTALCKVPGVGKKLAQRLALELKTKLPVGFEPDLGPAAAPRARHVGDEQLDLALARLGYTRSEIVRAHRALTDAGLGPDAPVADRLRAAIQVLSGAGTGGSA